GNPVEHFDRAYIPGQVEVFMQLPTAIFGAPIRGEAPDFRAPLPGSPISESMCAWIALICSA
ncbi:MAG: hypothetical protein ACLQFI_13935, partial [Methylocella sp.]